MQKNIKKSIIAILIVTIFIGTTLIPGIGIAKTKIKNTNNNLDLKSDDQQKVIIGGIINEGGVKPFDEEPIEIDDITYENIEDNIGEEENGIVSFINPNFKNKQNDLWDKIEEYRQAKDETSKTNLRNEVKPKIQEYIQYIDLPEEVENKITPQDYDYLTEIILEKAGQTSSSSSQSKGLLFGDVTRCFIGAIITGGFGKSRSFALFNPNIMFDLTILPMHTIYKWGGTGIYRPLLRIKVETGEHNLLTFGFYGLYIALGHISSNAFIGGYTEGLVFYLGVFFYTKLKMVRA